MAIKKVVGIPTPRVEGKDKVTGRAKYTVDVTLPGMLWGKVLRSPRVRIPPGEPNVDSALVGSRSLGGQGGVPKK